MAVNLTTNPYYDDFDSTKNFYRILFKPGTPVQARELTQIQSILQDQIKKFANHIFVDGSRILSDDPVAVTINDAGRAVKLQTNANTANLEVYLNKYVSGTTSNIIGRVDFVFDADNPDVGDPPTFVMSLIKSEGTSEFDSGETLYFHNTIAAANSKTASALTVSVVSDSYIVGNASINEYSDIITLSASAGTIKVGDQIISSSLGSDLFVVEVITSTSIRVNRNVGVTDSNVSIQFKTRNTSPTLIFGTSAGTYYKNGFFIQTAKQKIVPQKYTAYPTKSIVLRYQEYIVDYNDDSSLLDPAFGSSNYLAPGADRLKMELILDSVDLTADNKPDITGTFLEIGRYKNGNLDLVESTGDSKYAELAKTLASRTYAESGNYIVSPFKLQTAGPSPDGLDEKFYVTPGRAFVGGYDIATSGKTEISIPKAKTTDTVEALNIDTFFGTYVVIEAPTFGLPQLADLDGKDFYECHSTTNRTAMNNSTLVGYVVPKHIQYETGYGANSSFRFYWYYYEQASTTLTPDSIRSVIGVQNPFSINYGNNGTYAKPTFFANIHPTYGLIDNRLRYYDVGQNRNVFKIPKNNVKEVLKNKVVYSQLYPNTLGTGGIVTLSTGSPNKFVGPLGSSLTDSIKREYYTMVVRDSYSAGYPGNVFVPMENISATLDGTGTQLTINFNSVVLSGTVDIIATLENDTLQRRTKTLVENQTFNANIQVSQVNYSVLKSDVYAYKGIYKIGSNSYVGNYNSATTYSTNNLVQSNGLIFRANTASTGESLTNIAYWEKVKKESLLSYSLDTGQSDNWYDHGSVRFLGAQNTAPGNVLITFDYFTHSGTGALDAGSYPANLYTRIPTYRSVIDAEEFNLRDCLDYRPRRQDDTPLSVQPGYDGRTSNIFYFDSHIKPNPSEVPGTEADVEFYLGRIDRLYLNNRDASVNKTQNKFSIDSGIPDLNPKAPKDFTDSTRQLIATLYVDPYTASYQDILIEYNDAPRYTMKDISIIDQKLTALEKRVKKQGLDIIALNNVVFDRNGSQGNILYKTGMLVDNFSGYGPGYVKSPDFTAAIDTARQECRPAFAAIEHNLFYVTDPDVSILNDLVYMNYTEEEFISQTIASSRNVNPNPDGVIGDNGRAVIYPPVITGGGDLASLVYDNIVQENQLTVQQQNITIDQTSGVTGATSTISGETNTVTTIVKSSSTGSTVSASSSGGGKGGDADTSYMVT
jgi:hypothetical protein